MTDLDEIKLLKTEEQINNFELKKLTYYFTISSNFNKDEISIIRKNNTVEINCIKKIMSFDNIYEQTFKLLVEPHFIIFNIDMSNITDSTKKILKLELINIPETHSNINYIF
jgi:hypothetical protein